jgi:predicted metal-dependent hydrolase
MRSAATSTIQLSDRKVEYQVKPSRTAKKLRVRVGPHGVQVVRPTARPDDDIPPFLRRNEDWLLRELDRAEALLPVIKAPRHGHRTILFRGNVTPIRVARSISKRGQNKVACENGEILITQPAGSRTPPVRSLENWLRKQARAAIQAQLQAVLPRVRRSPGRLYVMEQRTKWGNCSTLGNLSFNWRLIMAPDFVLRYLVTHEAVHLAIPDHSQRFWLTVQSLFKETERARQWLVANAHRLLTPLLL